MKEWLDFEHLVARIYESISPDASVIHNDKIIGYETQTERQIDVSIRFREAGCNFLVIVQAKTNTKPLDVNVVGEFASVVKDVRATKGVLICNAGFTKKAQVYAQNIGVELYSAHDAKNKNWQTVLKLPIIWIRLFTLIRCEMVLNLDYGDTISTDFSNWKLSSNENKIGFSIWEHFVKQWNSGILPNNPEIPHYFKIHGNELKFLAGGEWREVVEVKFTYLIKREVMRNEVKTHEFTGLRNFLTDDIEFTQLGVSIPPRLPEHGWTEIGTEDEKMISTKPAIVTIESKPEIINPNQTTRKASEVSNVGNILDLEKRTIKVRRKNQAQLVFQTIDSSKQEMSFTEILSSIN